MTEIVQVILILIILAGHVKLYIDTGYQIPPELQKYYETIPPGHAALYDNGKFICYLDLR